MRKKLSKIEIATYLRDYSNLMLYMINQKNESVFNLFKQMLINDGREDFATKEYYLDMINVYSFYLLNKAYSFLADNLFDYLSEENLKEIIIPKNLFINEKDFNKFSKKQIIKFIRDALNHNNHTNRELYVLYKEDEKLKIEILLNDVNPIPFKIHIDVADYLNIMKGILYSNKIDLIVFSNTNTLKLYNENLFLELDKIYYRRYYFKHKENQNEIKSAVKKINARDDKDALINYFGSENVTYVDYKLNESQKLKMIEEFKVWKNQLKIDENSSVDYILPKVIPLGILKLKEINYSLSIPKYLLNFNEISCNDILNDAKKICFEEENTGMLSMPYKERKSNIEFMMTVFDFYSNFTFPLTIYYAYLFDTLITDDIIKIGNQEYPKNKIRNCFVHGRWFSGVNGSFELYDCNKGNKNELKSNWQASISFYEFLEASEKYYNEILCSEKSLKK